MGELVAAMAGAMAECGFAEFDGVNQHHGYRYASAASVIRRVNLALATRGIAVSVAEDLVTHTIGDKGAVAIIRCTITFRLGSESMESSALGEGRDKGDKSIAKASTAAYKYALAHTFAISWGAEDPEADASTDEAADERAAAIADAERSASSLGTSDDIRMWCATHGATWRSLDRGGSARKKIGEELVKACVSAGVETDQMVEWLAEVTG